MGFESGCSTWLGDQIALMLDTNTEYAKQLEGLFVSVHKELNRLPSLPAPVTVELVLTTCVRELRAGSLRLLRAAFEDLLQSIHFKERAQYRAEYKKEDVTADLQLWLYDRFKTWNKETQPCPK